MSRGNNQQTNTTVLNIQYFEKGRSAAVGYLDSNFQYVQAYLDPSTGDMLSTGKGNNRFFAFIGKGHTQLWLPSKAGKILIYGAIYFFILNIITGLILRPWPRKKRTGLPIEHPSELLPPGKKAGSHRLHSSLGFFVFPFSLVLIITGLSFDSMWLQRSVYYISSGRSLPAAGRPESGTSNGSPQLDMMAVDSLWRNYIQPSEGRSESFISLPSSKRSPVTLFINHKPGTYFKQDYLYFDRYTFRPLKADGPYNMRYSDASLADVLIQMNYDIHTGAVLGFPGKILVFLVSLVIFLLPVTGSIIWWRRIRKRWITHFPEKKVSP